MPTLLQFRPRATLVLLGLGVLLAGCAGLHAGVGESFEVTPRRAFLAPGGNLIIHVYATEIPYDRYSFEVQEGAAGGTIVPNGDDPGSATYTAPATPGTYHVRAGIVQSPASSRLRTVTLVVR